MYLNAVLSIQVVAIVFVTSENHCGPGGSGGNSEEGWKVGCCGKDGWDGAKWGDGENFGQS